MTDVLLILLALAAVYWWRWGRDRTPKPPPQSVLEREVWWNRWWIRLSRNDNV